MRPESEIQATEEQTAENVINQAVEDGSSFREIDAELAEKERAMEAEARATIEHYRQEMRGITQGMLVHDLGGNTAGLYNGSDVFIDRRVLQVGLSVEQTISQATEVSDHEAYHAEHHHTAPMQIAAEARGGIAAVIGGKEFSETALIEGLTVHQTGDEFVSEDYVGYQDSLVTAVRNAGLSISDVEEAVNEQKDLTLIDDRTRKPSEKNYAVAA